MRTIKFRAKTLGDNNVWVFGDLHIRSAFAHIHTDLGTKSNIDTDTIGQFTGLYDKDGKEIYEGDIILEKLKRSRKDGDLYEIVFEDCQWFGKNKDGAATSLSLLNDFHVIKIIGNIHDNPEILRRGGGK